MERCDKCVGGGVKSDMHTFRVT